MKPALLLLVLLVLAVVEVRGKRSNKYRKNKHKYLSAPSEHKKEIQDLQANVTALWNALNAQRGLNLTEGAQDDPVSVSFSGMSGEEMSSRHDSSGTHVHVHMHMDGMRGDAGHSSHGMHHMNRHDGSSMSRTKSASHQKYPSHHGGSHTKASGYGNRTKSASHQKYPSHHDGSHTKASGYGNRTKSASHQKYPNHHDGSHTKASGYGNSTKSASHQKYPSHPHGVHALPGGKRPWEQSMHSMPDPSKYRYARCDLHASPSNINGTVYLRQKMYKPIDVLIHLDGFMQDMSKHHHGFHVHEFGDFSDGCQSFGGHYNPMGVEHGGPQEAQRHAGDWGNIHCDAKGQVRKLISDTHTDLIGPHFIVGRGIVIHDSHDDMGKGDNSLSKKSGDAGRRIACCTIAWSQDVDWDALVKTVLQ